MARSDRVEGFGASVIQGESIRFRASGIHGVPMVAAVVD